MHTYGKELKRQAALEKLRILDTLPEDEFDGIVELISEICDTPIALISLVDGHRQWFKARVGLEAQETQKEIAFCAHALLQNEVMIVKDALQDERFKNNPLVVGDPHIRFYAGAPLKTDDGFNLGTLCVIDKKSRDLTERQVNVLKKLAKQVVRLFEMRIKLLKSEKSEFLSKMSHEIRTPINGIVGLTDLMLGFDLPKEQRIRAEQVKSCSHDLLRIVDHIFDFSQFEDGKIELENVEFSLKKILSEVGISMGYLASRKNLHISRRIGLEVPDKVFGDPVRLRQTLLHLVGNAIKFTQKGHITLKCQLKASLNQGESLRFEIHDTGVGISRAAKENLFQSFTQADNTVSRSFGGVGLGLAISKELIYLMNGTIGFESEEGKGSLFWFEIPLARVEIKKNEYFGPSLNLRVLIAEGDTVNQLVAVNIIKSLGYSAEAVGNGFEVLEALNRGNYDLILMDCLMPVLDGCEATRKIRSNVEKSYSQIPIFAMTANSTTGYEVTCLKVGMNACISKPIDENRLQRLIAEHVFHKAS